MKRLASVVAAMILAGSVAVALGQGGGGGGGGGRGGRGAGGQGRAGGQGGQNGGGQGNPSGGRGGAIGINVNFYINEYDTMVTVLNLTDDQKPKVKTEADAMNYELTTFQQNAQGQFAGGRGGRRAGAGAAPGAQQTAMAKMQDDFQLLADEHQIKISAQLTPEQRLTWETYKLNLILDPRLNPLALSDDQKEKVKGLVDDTAKAITALTEGKDLQALEGRMIRKIVDDILTEPQASRFVQGPLQLGGRGGLAGGGQFGGAAGAGGQGNGGAGGFGGAGGGRGGRGGGRGGRAGGAPAAPQAALP